MTKKDEKQPSTMLVAREELNRRIDSIFGETTKRPIERYRDPNHVTIAEARKSKIIRTEPK